MKGTNSSDTQFKLLKNIDYSFIKGVYDYYVLNSTATFHTKPVEIEELKESIKCNHAKYKSYLIYFNNVPCGFCYLGRYKPRQAYDRTSELTLYIKPEFQGKGIGKLAVEFLIDQAKNLGFKNLLGIITAENKASMLLFEKTGFEKCAHFKNVGEKFNRILDVVAYQKEL